MKTRVELERILRKALQRTGFHRAATLIVACSGGPDSTALLHALVALQPALSLQLHVAHLNHDFRGQEAEDDALFVANMAERLDLPSTVAEADPIAYQRERGISSFEEAAREVRYRFLTELAHRIHADAVVLGHTADDQAETILMHIIRGAGLPGLRGMQEVTRWHNPPTGQSAVLLRPLLEASRNDTHSYCLELAIPFRVDSTNTSLRFTRNRIRHKLLPVLEEYNPRVREALIRTGRAASESLHFLNEQLNALWPEMFSKDGRTVHVDASALNDLHPYLRGLALRRAFAEARGSSRRLAESHVKSMLDLSQGPAGKSMHLPGGLAMQTTQAGLIIGPIEQDENVTPTLDFEYPINVPGTTQIAGWRVTVEPASPTLDPKTLEPTAALFDADQLGDHPVIRNKRPGDYIQPLGMRGRKKLKDLLIDLKVLRELRPSIPLLVSEKGVLWVFPYRTSEMAKVDESTRRRLLIRWEPAP